MPLVFDVVHLAARHVVPADDARMCADKARWAPDGETIYCHLQSPRRLLRRMGDRFDAVKGTTVGDGSA